MDTVLSGLKDNVEDKEDTTELFLNTRKNYYTQLFLSFNQKAFMENCLNSISFREKRE